MTIADEPPHRFGRYAATAEAGTARGLLDVDDGVQRVMGDRALYERMLRRFCRDYGEGADPIRRALANGDQRLAHRLAHTLKGASGMIGATVVYHQSSLLEAELRVSSSPHSELIAPLDDALAAVARVIAPMLAPVDSHGGAPHAPVRTPHPVQALLVAQLADLLDRGDGAALDLLEQSEGSLRAALGANGFDAVATAANEFDFEAALAALNRARRETAGD